MPPGHTHSPSQRPSLPGCPVSAGDSVKNTDKYISTKTKTTEHNNEGSQAGGGVSGDGGTGKECMDPTQGPLASTQGGPKGELPAVPISHRAINPLKY